MSKWFAPPDGGYIPKYAPEFHGLPPKIPAQDKADKPLLMGDIDFTQGDKKIRLLLWSDGSVTWVNLRD